MKLLLITTIALTIQVTIVLAQSEIDTWALSSAHEMAITTHNLSGRTAPDLKPDLRAGQQMAHFPNLASWLTHAMMYPESGRERGIEGSVTLELLIAANGEVMDVRVIRSLEEAFDQVAVETLLAMPAWIPAHNYGVPVRGKARVDVAFVLR